MSQKGARAISYSVLEIDGARYAVLREASLISALQKAGLRPDAESGTLASERPPDDAALAKRLRQRRQGVGLSQAALARLADVRVETLNRIERGHTTPDFATIRKLVEAMQKFEARQAQS